MTEIRLLRPDEIDARVQRVTPKGVMLLLYKDARCDMNILDETFGPMGWKREHQLIGERLYCTVSVWDGKQWIAKQDVGTESNTEKEKGQASDSFKRACFNWGIGRELYTAPFIWFNTGEADVREGKCFDGFKVKELQYAGRKIASVTIEDTKTHCIKEFKTDAMDERIGEKLGKVVEQMLVSNESDVKKCMEYYKIKDLSELTYRQYVNVVKNIEKKVKSA